MKYKALNCYSTLEQKMFTGVIAQVCTYYPEQLTASLPNILVCLEAGKEAGATLVKLTL